ncbi:baculoviral IAP repeat-containing protein 8-like [Paramacrobiotus metropolitanus]|uniref:baculoviral IAP repeat-containing protein 8-like n=1 Tax=Paramacrobiotus metropolitanus TaxID=2943436 RepID=UPI002445EE37|nr:baculoviral IAP repeat-containing protein 8-like [Paramacrobiotus metropolitanus]
MSRSESEVTSCSDTEADADVYDGEASEEEFAGFEVYSKDIITKVYCPKMQSYESRFATFARWPSSPHQHPQEMAAAGFYFINYCILTRCFYCGMGRDCWRENEDPWEIHAALRPQCPYLMEQKGESFINTIQQKKQNKYRNASKEDEDALLWPDNVAEEEKILQALQFYSWEHVMEALRRRPSARIMAQSELGFPWSVPWLEQGCRDSERRERNARMKGNSEEHLRAVREHWRRIFLRSPADHLAEVKDEKLCKICYTNVITQVLYPCGHFVVCNCCVKDCDGCPMCRSVIKKILPVYFC